MIEEFLIFCSGANNKILQECPMEKTKFTGIGATILMTSIMAGISGYYTISSISNDLLLSFIVCISWGVVVFSLERFFVSTQKKTNSFKRETLVVLPRLFFAILLAIIISKPLEMKIFQNFINTKVNDDFFSRLQALNELKKVGSSIWWASIMINLLFFVVISMPIIIKLLSIKGPYEEIIDRIEYEILLKQRKIIAEVNDEMNNFLPELQKINKLKGETKIKMESLRLDTELKLNEALLHEIAKKQAELANVSLDKWYSDEVLSLKSKPSYKHGPMKRNFAEEIEIPKILPDSQEVGKALEEIKKQIRSSLTETLDR